MELRRIGGLVIGAVEETDIPETRVQLILYAADDLNKGWTHLRIVLPTHSHQLKPANTHKHTQIGQVSIQQQHVLLQ